MVSSTAGGRPLKSAASRPGATHGGSIDLDAGAIWCRAPERGGPFSEDVNPSPDAAIDILSTDGAPNEMLGAPWDGPAKSPGNRMGCSLHEE